MQITRSSVETQRGPADWFTGDVYIDVTWGEHVSDGRYAGGRPA